MEKIMPFRQNQETISAAIGLMESAVTHLIEVEKMSKSEARSLVQRNFTRANADPNVVITIEELCKPLA